MVIFDTVKLKVREAGKEKIAQQLGYHSVNKGLEAIETFLSSNSLYSWIHESGFFDFRYSSVEVFEQLAAVCGIDKAQTEEALASLNSVAEEMKRCRYVLLSAVIPNQHIHIQSWSMVYAYAWRDMEIPPERLAFKRGDDLLKEIASMIKEHYKNALAAGKEGVKYVESYQYFHRNEANYYFTITGKLIAKKEVR
jgi:hypothetical protein